MMSSRKSSSASTASTRPGVVPREEPASDSPSPAGLYCSTMDPWRSRAAWAKAPPSMPSCLSLPPPSRIYFPLGEESQIARSQSDEIETLRGSNSVPADLEAKRGSALSEAEGIEDQNCCQEETCIATRRPPR